MVKAVDKASGYIFGERDDATMAMMSSAMGADFDFFKYPSLHGLRRNHIFRRCLLLYYYCLLSDFP